MSRKTPGEVREEVYKVDGDLDESIKRNASDRLGDLVPQVRARTSPGVFRDMALLGLCLELSFNVKDNRRQDEDWRSCCQHSRSSPLRDPGPAAGLRVSPTFGSRSRSPF